MAMIVFLVLSFFGYLNDLSDGCKLGFYGDSCSKVCPNFCHDNECNITTGKCLSCVKGHYSNNTKDCVPCPQHCTACSSDQFCFACISGFRGEVCENNCTNCRPYTSCDKNTGYCFENCSEGQSGELCNIPCDSKCKSCDRHNKDDCILCADGYQVEKHCNQTYTVCNIRCKALTEMQPDRQGSSTYNADIGLIVGVVIGSLTGGVCVCLIVMIIVRSRSTIRRSSWCMSGERNVTAVTNESEHVELLPRETRITETRELPSKDKLTVLQMKGALSAIEKKYDNMKIIVAENKVTVEGDPLDNENVFKQIEIKCNMVKHAHYKHNKSRECVRFYEEKQTLEYIKRKLEQKQLIGVWYINGTQLTVFVHGKGNNECFKNTLLESVLETLIPVDKSLTNLLDTEWWGEFLLDIRKKFQEKVKIFTNKRQYVTIICTDDVEQHVGTLTKEFFAGIIDEIQCKPGVCEFVSNYWTQDDFDEIRRIGVMIKSGANGFRLRGILNNVNEGKRLLNMKLEHIYSKEHVLTGIGIFTLLEAAVHSGKFNDIAKECRCVIKLQNKIDESLSVMLNDYDDIDPQLLEETYQDSSNNASPKCFRTRRHKIKMQLIQGNIMQQNVRADIIVVGAGSMRDLQSGSSLYSSLNQGGPQLQSDYIRVDQNGKLNDEVEAIDTLDFNILYFTSLPPWKEASRDGGKVLRNFLRECLRLADKFDKKTISFSSMMTEVKLEYPTDMVVRILFGAVVEFDCCYSKTSLKEINFFMDNEDDETFKTIIRLLKKKGRETRTKRIFLENGTILTKPYEESKYRMIKDGCAIGSVQLQVQVGNSLNCTADAIVKDVGSNIDTKEHVVMKDEVVITDSAEVNAKYVINVMFKDTLADWRRKLVYCLKKADEKAIKSVALTVVGSEYGRKTFRADDKGQCLFAAVDDFVSQNPESSVTDVILVVPDFNAGCIPAIIAEFQTRISAVNFQLGIGKLFKSQLGWVTDPNQFKECAVTFHSDAKINVDRCIEALNDRIGLEYSTKVLDVQMDDISSFNDEKINSLEYSDILVDISFDKQAGTFTIVGPLRNVQAAIPFVRNKMQHYNSRNSAKVLYDQTKWHWKCEDRSALGKEVPYDMMTNFVVETAFREGQQTVALQSNDGKIYVIDFQKLKEYDKLNINDTVMVIRKDILKDIKTPLHVSWWNAVTGDDVARETLRGGAKYQKVEKRFLEEVQKGLYANVENIIQSVKVVKIERIRNRTLYKQYKAKKEEMEKQKYECKEMKRKLWHGTTEGSIQNVIDDGFNRSYCGVHEDAYGQGVYFSADAFYFVQSNLAENNPGAKRYMFLAKVLTGELVKGDPSMRFLPLGDPVHSSVMHGSAVDDVENPTQFVIFHYNQAYPKYLITYTSNKVEEQV